MSTKHIKISTIEKYTYLFNSENKEFNDIKWLEPIFVTMASAYDDGVDYDLITDNQYLYSMLTMNYKENKSYTPVEKITTRNGLEKISTHLTNIMLKNFSDLEASDIKDLRDYLQYLFLELMNNVADHAQSNGHVMAQYYPTNKKVQFAVADRGVGFLQNIKLKYKDVSSEEEAIFKALEKGVTATPEKMYGQEKNAGYGLYAMLEILKQTNGKFTIISNDTLVRYKNHKYTVKKLDESWEGVAIAFEFNEAEINFTMDHFSKNYLWNDFVNDDEEDFF